MSVNANIGGFPETLEYGTASTTTADIYTMAANDDGVVVKEVRAVNTDSSDRQVTIYWYDAANTTAVPLFSKSISANSSETIPMTVRMVAGDKIQAYAAANSVVEITVLIQRLSRGAGVIGQ